MAHAHSWHSPAGAWISPHRLDVYGKCTRLPVKRLCINVFAFSFSCFICDYRFFFSLLSSLVLIGRITFIGDLWNEHRSSMSDVMSIVLVVVFFLV